MERTLDIKGLSLGRAATEAAMILRGKDRADFANNVVLDIKLNIKNVEKLNISEAKKEQKKYKHFSGYPSGLKETEMGKVWEKDPGEVFRRTVWGMLPKNKLRKQVIKNLIIDKREK